MTSQSFQNSQTLGQFFERLYGHYKLPPFTSDSDSRSFIQYGFARTRSQELVIDKPLVIMAAWKWLEKEHHFSLFRHLQCRTGDHAPRKNGFEAYLAYYM